VRRRMQPLPAGAGLGDSSARCQRACQAFGGEEAALENRSRRLCLWSFVRSPEL
jgi:hypothetical protein